MAKPIQKILLLKTFPLTPADARMVRRLSVTWRRGSLVPSEKTDTGLEGGHSDKGSGKGRTEHVVSNGTSVRNASDS